MELGLEYSYQGLVAKLYLVNRNNKTNEVTEKSQKESYQYGDPIKFEEGEKPLQKWRKQRDRVESEIKERRLELAEIFRELIGVEKEKN